MKSELSDEQIQEVVDALDKALTTGPWGESSFLRVIGKNLQDIRDNFVSEIKHEDPASAPSASHLANRVALRAGQQEIFISLYTTEGSEIHSWERLLANLPKHVVSRPVYSNEEEVKRLIKAKDNPVNEAYVAVYVSKSDILELPDERISRDRYGIRLLALKDRVILPENISRFVHRTGVYHYNRGRLGLLSKEA